MRTDSNSDGFYRVGDTDRPEPKYQRALIAVFRQVTHIAEPDEHRCLIGTPLQQPRFINYPIRDLGLCNGITHTRFVTTTEVYPDSAGVSAEECIEAQGVVVSAGFGYLRRG